MTRVPKTLRTWVFVGTLAALVVGVAFAGASRDCGTWRVVDSPNAGGADNFLFGAAVTAADDAWAVGSFRSAGGGSRTLALHWNGRAWTIIPTPNRGEGDNFLNAVAASSRSSAWAVGMYRDERGRARTLAMRWDGRRWALVPTPNFSSVDHHLSSVAASPDGSAWAVGYARHGDTFRSLVLRWNGRRWTPTPVPVHDTGGHALESVAVAEGRAWAVGGYWRTNGGHEPLVLAWDGSAWRRADGSLATQHGTVLGGVSASASGTAWIVGGFPGIRGSGAFVASSLGDGWIDVERASAGLRSDSLSGIAAFADGAWAVGTASDGGLDRTLIERARNGGWERTYSPNVAGRDNHLLDVAALPTGEAWAVGSTTGADGTERTLIQHFCPAEPVRTA